MTSSDTWTNHPPAWRIAKLRAALREAHARGADPNDDGAGIEHRALRRAFQAGRDYVPDLQKLRDRAFTAWDALRSGKMSAADANAIGRDVGKEIRSYRRKKC